MGQGLGDYMTMSDLSANPSEKQKLTSFSDASSNNGTINATNNNFISPSSDDEDEELVYCHEDNLDLIGKKRKLKVGKILEQCHRSKIFYQKYYLLLIGMLTFQYFIFGVSTALKGLQSKSANLICCLLYTTLQLRKIGNTDACFNICCPKSDYHAFLPLRVFSSYFCWNRRRKQKQCFCSCCCYSDVHDR